MKKICLEKISVDYFKSIVGVTDLPLENLNIIIGANGVGKSNFIAIFQMLENMSRLNFQEYTRQSGNPESLFYFEHTTPRSVHLKFNFKSGRKKLAYYVELKCDHKSQAYFSQEFATDDKSLVIDTKFYNGDYPSAIVRNMESQLDSWGREPKNNLYPIYEAISSWRAYHFHDTSIGSVLRRPNNVGEDKNLLQTGENLASYLFYLKEKHRNIYERIVKCIRCVAPFFLDFSFKGNWKELKESRGQVTLNWKQKNSERLMYPWQLSDGTLRFIALVVVLLQPDPPSLILIDEPELGLHPAAISFLAGLLHEAATRTQIIVTTQSPLLLDSMEPKNIIVMTSKHNMSSCAKLDGKSLSVWLREYSLGDLWNKGILGAGPYHE